MNPPTHIGKYRIDGVLGEGAMGIVYRGTDPDTGTTVAIKTIRIASAADAQDFDAFARFKREGTAGARLSHPNVVRIHEYGEQGEIAYIVMDFVAGESMRALIARRGRVPLYEALDLAYQLLGALDHFHKRGIVHRDIKPSNIMVTPEQRLVVTDFGIARVENSTLTKVGTVLGTPWYMSPEQIAEQPLDGRSDLFSVGIILYEMLTGLNPFKADQLVKVLDRIVAEPHAPPSSIIPGLPPAVDALFERALAKKPAHRFQNGDSFRSALQEMLAQIIPDRNNTAGWKGKPRPAPPAQPAAPAAEAFDLPEMKLGSSRRARSRAMGLTIAALVVAGILMLIATSGTKDTKPAEPRPPTPSVALKAIPPPAPAEKPATPQPADEDKLVAEIRRQCQSEQVERVLIPDVNGIVRCEKTPVCSWSDDALHAFHQKLNEGLTPAALSEAICTATILGKP